MKRNFLRATQWIVLIASLALIAAAILFPIFAKPDRRPYGIVLDGANKPIPGAVLRFRDGTGQVIASFTADAQGEFRSRRLYDLRKNAVDGFALTRDVHNTGGINHYYFSPLGTQTFLIRDAHGKPIVGLDVMLHPTGPYYFLNPYKEPNGVSDQNGLAQFNNLPVGARYEVDCRGNWYAVSSVLSFADAHTARYDVTVAPSATIAGRLATPNGKPLAHYKVLADRVPGQNSIVTPSTTTNSRGRFRLTSLHPGSYHIAVASSASGGYEPSDFFTELFTVISGQAIDVSLQYRLGRGAETARLNRR